MILKRVLNPALYSDFIHRFSGNYRQQQKSLKVLHETSLKVIQQRILERKERSQSDGNISEKQEEAISGERIKKAFLDMLLDASENDNHSLSVQDIREEVDTFMFEGHDTTSAALGWVIFCVGNHSDVQQKIYEELDDIFDNSDRPPNTNDLARMKYLECVLKEAMRLFPPVPVLSRRLVVDTKMGEYDVPADTTVLIHIHQIHRSAEYFPNPEQFNPSNFSSHRDSRLSPYGYVPFSAGPRNCIGQKFAMIEEKILLSSFFRKFAVESIEKMETIVSAPDTILRPTRGIFVRLKKRK